MMTYGDIYIYEGDIMDTQGVCCRQSSVREHKTIQNIILTF